MMDKKKLTEQEIRTQYITPAIQSSGWKPSQIREEYAITAGRIIAYGGAYKRETPKRADYVLFYKSHIPLAIVEAKDNTHTVSSGMQQALEYAEMLNIPFVFTSNGDAFTFHNKLESSSDMVKELALESFPSPEELWQMYKGENAISTNIEKLVEYPYYTDNKEKSPRYYQLNAINKTMEAIAKGKERLLLVMATGTGKTYTAFQIIWRLWKSGTKKRILFLADRNVLIDQTYNNDFAPFQDKMTLVKNHELDTAYEIYLALYQGLTGEGDKKIFKSVSPNFFDLIIIDECHRGSAKEDSEWREILDYFSNATQIGMTATPKNTDETSNFDYFGNPIYTYSLKQGIEDGFLAPYRVNRVILNKDAEGFRPYTGQTDKIGAYIPDQEYNIKDYDRTLVLENRTKMVAKVVSNYLKKHDIRFDKTIFFCVDTEHADRMRTALINENSDLMQENDKYVMRITGDDAIGKKQVENFRNVKEKYPVLVTTSKLLTTGVDTKMLKIVVLDANINSMTEFKQIIGRGMRIVEEKGKMFFTIFDFRNVTRLFADKEFDGESLSEEELTPDEHGNVIDETSPQDDETPEAINDKKDDKKTANPDDDEESEPREKIYVNDVEVTVLSEQVRYINGQGKLVTESYTDFTRKNVLNNFATLEDFFKTWQNAERKEIIIEELEKQGVLFEALQKHVGKEFDPFDLICHIAFDKKPLTRQERANNVKKRDYFAKYGEQAKQVLYALLDNYADTGIENMEDLQVLNLYPINTFGTPQTIVNTIFNGKQNFTQVLEELRYALYEEDLV